MPLNRYGDEDTDGNLNDLQETYHLMIIKTMVVWIIS